MTDRGLKLNQTNWTSRYRINLFSVVLYLISSIFIYFLVKSISGTRNIALAICITAILVPIQVQRNRMAKKSKELTRSWPEVIDQLVSGIQSGLSLNEGVIALSLRGPKVTREIFSQVAEYHLKGKSFSEAMAFMKDACKSVEADQIAETLILARRLGGKDVGIVLRLLGDFFRENLALREEIHAKHGWIRNSATLAAFAPWLLLLILSTQESTRITYSSSSGLLVLFGGAITTILAFLWMEIVGRIPERKRIFAIKNEYIRSDIRSEDQFL